ncbi:MAG: zinc ribbon domain-containing protein [Selenomonas sp.]|nr:zinc ribbon domain-containing protein [Selenomonas sp.]
MAYLCKKCGNKVNEKDSFCGKCGEKIVPEEKTSKRNMVGTGYLAATAGVAVMEGNKEAEAAATNEEVSTDMSDTSAIDGEILDSVADVSDNVEKTGGILDFLSDLF